MSYERSRLSSRCRPHALRKADSEVELLDGSVNIILKLFQKPILAGRPSESLAATRSRTRVGADGPPDAVNSGLLLKGNMVNLLGVDDTLGLRRERGQRTELRARAEEKGSRGGGERDARQWLPRRSLLQLQSRSVRMHHSCPCH